MEYGYTQQLWSPPRGRTLEEVRAFLQRMGLSYAQGIEHTAVVRDGSGAVAATASLEGHVIKCVAVDPDAQGAGLTATVVTALAGMLLGVLSTRIKGIYFAILTIGFALFFSLLL